MKAKGAMAMKANDLVELLESEWQSISERLGEKWDEFLAAYRGIVATLPDEPTRSDLERVADAICSLMRRYDYTLGLLRGWQGVLSERLILGADETLKERERVRQICNRFKQLVSEESKQTKAEQKEQPCSKKRAS